MKPEIEKLIEKLSDQIATATYENHGLMHNGKLAEDASGVLYLEDLNYIKRELTNKVNELIK